MIVNCPKCGTKMESESLGWKCKVCKGFVDVIGEFHEHVERPFMPPMRRIDKIKAKETDEFVNWMVFEFPDIMEKCNHAGISLSKYFEEVETEDEHRT